MSLDGAAWRFGVSRSVRSNRRRPSRADCRRRRCCVGERRRRVDRLESLYRRDLFREQARASRPDRRVACGGNVPARRPVHAGSMWCSRRRFSGPLTATGSALRGGQCQPLWQLAAAAAAQDRCLAGAQFV